LSCFKWSLLKEGFSCLSSWLHSHSQAFQSSKTPFLVDFLLISYSSNTPPLFLNTLPSSINSYSSVSLRTLNSIFQVWCSHLATAQAPTICNLPFSSAVSAPTLINLPSILDPLYEQVDFWVHLFSLGFRFYS